MFFNQGNKKQDTELYDILGVTKSSSGQEIKKSYRKLAMKYHPDRNKAPEAETKFKKISMAYDVLSDKEKKEKYDKFGLEGLQGGGGGPNPFDIFSNLFGGGGGGGAGMFHSFARNQPRKKRTKDRLEVIEVKIEDIYNESILNMNYSKKVVCNICSGLGTMSSENIQVCKICNGNGRIMRIVQLGPNMISQSQETCSSCMGRGKYINDEDKCGICNGNKLISETKQLKLELKNTLKHEEKIVFEGESDQDIGADEYGDLVLILKFKPHATFKIINNYDLFIEKNISLAEAICGFTLKLDHLDGKDITIQVKEIINPYSNKRIVGEGLNSTGDLIIKFNIQFPEKISDERKTYIAKLLNYSIPEINKEHLNNYVLENTLEQFNEPKQEEHHDTREEMNEGVECHQQ
jgi:DnaJ homolog subfamily A member 2